MNCTQLFLASFFIYSSVSAVHNTMHEIITRLEKHVEYVRKLHQTSKLIALVMPEKEQFTTNVRTLLFMEEIVQFSSDTIITCVQDMREQENIEPFFTMWDALDKKHIKDTAENRLFLKECAMLNFTFYNNLIVQASQKNNSQISVEDIIKLYRYIAALPIGELLDLLDKILDHVIDIVRESSEQGFLQWFLHNWWVPPLMISSFISNFFTDGAS